MRRMSLYRPRTLQRCSESIKRASCPPLRPATPIAPLKQLRMSSSDKGPKPDLYKLLFPEEGQTEEQERRLQNLSSRARVAAAEARKNEPAAPEESSATRKKSQIAAAKRVLILRGASKNLIREDFLRIIPPGKNLEGWVSDRTFVERIVQDRDLETLERKGTYYLIFKTAAATAEYQKRAIRLSKLLNFHGPPSQISERRIPSDLIFKGEDVRTLLRSYTLTPYGSALRLYQPANELPPEVAAIAGRGGLPQIVNRPGRMAAEVAVRLPMSPLSKPELEKAIAQAEVERNLPWTGSSFSQFKCEEWSPPTTGGTRVAWRSLKLGGEGSQPMAKDEDALTSLDEVDTEGKRSVFVVGLQTHGEADAFVRYWHRRTITLPKQHRSQPPVIVDADIL